MIIGYVWVIPHTLEAIDSNVSYITHTKKYFSKLYEYDINLWIIAMLIFCIFTAISVLILKLPDYKKSTHIKKYSQTNRRKKSKREGVESNYFLC
jgi:capsular polysaccharide biosynthesis protein